MTFSCVEQIALESVSVNEDGSRRVRLISPGQGSSGFYTREVLQRDIAKALPKGTLVYVDHSDDETLAEERVRSFKDIAGKFVSDPVYETNAKEGEGSYANIKFTKNVESTLEDIGDAVAVSIEIHRGKRDSGGNITELAAFPLNSLALVPVGGRDGRIFEDFRAKAQENHDNGGSDMTISEEDRKAIVADVTAALTEALKPKPAEEPEPVVVDHAAVVEAVVKAKLPTELVSSVVSLVESGKTVEDAIKEQTALVEAIRGKKDGEGEAELVLTEGASPQDKKDDIKTMTPTQRGEKYMETYFSKGGKA